MSNLNENAKLLAKALEAGSLTGAPGTLVQGAATQTQEIDDIMHIVTFQDKHIKLQKIFPVKKHKSTLVRFRRTNAYGAMGHSANYEGMVGKENTGTYTEAYVPMCYYSHLRRLTVVAETVETFDGVKNDDRENNMAAALLIAADVELDMFGGRAHFSNGGVFDGNPNAQADLPNIPGFDVQLRESDLFSQSRDLMFAEYGSDQSVVLSAGGGNLGQILLHDLRTRSELGFGTAATLHVDIVALANYNKQVIQAGSNINQYATMGQALTSTGSDLRRQDTSYGPVKIEPSQFLRGDKKAQMPSVGAPAAPTLSSATAASGGAVAAGTYIYRITAVNENGEGAPVDSSGVVVTAGQKVTLALASNGAIGTRFFNVYRTVAGAASAASARFIGRVKANGVGSTSFVDLGNRTPGFTNAYLVDDESATLRELAPYSRRLMAMQDLSTATAHYRFLTMAVEKPRTSAICENIAGKLVNS